MERVLICMDHFKVFEYAECDVVCLSQLKPIGIQ